jgi:hypothetical protein
MEDRRVHPRIAAPLKASWHRGSVRCVTRTVNLSLGGCFLESLDREPPAGRLRLRLQLPRNEFIWLSGEVAYFVSERGFGVKFVNVSEESSMALNRAIANLTGRPLL